jgi:SAM-dependent methyltransferase
MTSYFASENPSSLESERLRLLVEMLDPLTAANFDAVGVKPGWNCLEVGAGSGTIARNLSQRVGNTGSVVATDVDTGFLCRLGEIPNIEVRTHDIVTDELETDCYDLVHCRLLLMHLGGNPICAQKALSRMFHAVKPGGWLVIEEGDLGLLRSAAPDHRQSERFDDSFGSVTKSLHDEGMMDPHFGRKLRGLLEQLELQDIGHEARTWVHRGGEAGAKRTWMNVNSEPLRSVLLNRCALTKEDYEALSIIFEDPTFLFVDTVMFSAWGRRMLKSPVRQWHDIS